MPVRENHAQARRTTPTTGITHRDFLTMQPLITWMRKVAPRYVRGTLLDYGCGNMPYRPMLEPFLSRYVGVDVTQNTLGTVDHLVAVGQSLPQPEASIDTVLSNQVLEHVADPIAYIGEAARVLKSGGYLILTCPGAYMLHEEPYDYYRYTTYGLHHLLNRAGLTIVRIDPAGGAWRLLGQTFLNHKAFGRRFHIPLVSGAIFKILVIVVNLVCDLLDRANTNVKETVNYQVVAGKP